MAHWRKPYKQAAPLAAPERLAHAGSVKAGRGLRDDSPSWWRIVLGAACWVIVIGALWVANRVF